MSRFSISKLHRYLRSTRSRTEKGKDAEVSKRLAKPKSYPRMPQIPLLPADSTISLADALRKRKSARAYADVPIPFSALSGMLGLALHSGETTRRPHPSGGGCFPIETYVIVSNVEGLSRGVYHYRGDTHALEYLWSVGEEHDIRSLIYDKRFATPIPALVVLTAQWEKTLTRYDDFGLELVLMEAGHIGQNLVLAATASDLSTSSLADFKDEPLQELLDLDPLAEQTVYTFTLGIPPS